LGLLHVRYDEVGLKGGNRPLFEKKLRKNIARQLGLGEGTVRRSRGRIIVDAGERDPRTVLPDVARCFGVASASPILVVARDRVNPGSPTELDAIYAAANDLAREAVGRGLKTFRIEGRRADKRYPIPSFDLAGRVGAAVLKGTPGLKVNLTEPEFTIGLEVRNEGFALHALAVAGPGGVPVGISGRALVLLSGGIDSPVAAWYTMKRGLQADWVYFHSFPYTGEKAKEKVLSLARELSRWSGDALFGFVPNLAKIQDAIAAAGQEEMRIVVLRRFMYRIANRIATLRNQKALVTGEVLGQVASQTPENLLCVEVTVPGTLVLRPLLGMDKQEVIARAKAIGTFETSIQPYQDCCSLFAPRHPTTRATPEQCLEIESKLDVNGLEEEAVAATEVWKVQRGAAPERLEGVGVKKNRFLEQSEQAAQAKAAATPAPAPPKDEPEEDEEETFPDAGDADDAVQSDRDRFDEG
jgi:thiamine biosynthesis protein ThiI